MYTGMEGNEEEEEEEEEEEGDDVVVDNKRVAHNSRNFNIFSMCS